MTCTLQFNGVAQSTRLHDIKLDCSRNFHFDIHFNSEEGLFCFQDILSLGIETHFVELPSEHLKAYEEVVSRVTHSSDVVFSRTWHASSIKVLVEPKQVILKIFRL